ncbi:MAG: DUF6515 family protein [Reichenbachiella sp.]|uniref:DUF6515 family protein n=1 Tax=Reichenbachiella sp. TaxID=2184521 RepID=UPI003264A38D
MKFLLKTSFLVLISLAAFQSYAQKRKPRKEVVVVSRGRVVKKVHKTHVVVAHKGVDYRYVNGVFYKPRNSKFVVVGAPVGVRVRTLPVSHIRIYVRSNPFYYYNGIFYRKIVNSDEYEVVQPPVGARVSELPEGTEMIILDGQKYFELDGYYYQEVITNSNELNYEVVRNP